MNFSYYETGSCLHSEAAPCYLCAAFNLFHKLSVFIFCSKLLVLSISVTCLLDQNAAEIGL